MPPIRAGLGLRLGAVALFAVAPAAAADGMYAPAMQDPQLSAAATAAGAEEAEADGTAQAAGAAASQQVAQACIAALAQREQKPEGEVLNELRGVVMAGVSLASPSCDIAAATASPVAIYMGSLGAWLREAGPGIQIVMSIISIAAGLACAWDGPTIWRALFTICAALAAAGITHHEASLWGLCPNLISDLVLMMQAGAAVALAVHVGFEGSQVLLGVMLGLVGSYGFGDWARALEISAPGISLLWYELGAVCGFLLYTVWRKAVLSTVSPLLGGFLVTVGVGVLLGRLVALAGATPHILPSAQTPWITAATLMLGRGGALALPVHCACAMLASLVHSCWEVRWLSVGILVSSSFLAAASAATGFLCSLWGGSDPQGPGAVLHSGTGCPEWLASTPDWQWPVFGCLLWAAITCAAAWRQLGLLAKWEAENFWRSDVMYHETRGGPLPFEDPDAPSAPYATRLPGYYGAEGDDFPLTGAPPPPMRSGMETLSQGLGNWWHSVNQQPAGAQDKLPRSDSRAPYMKGHRMQP